MDYISLEYDTVKDSFGQGNERNCSIKDSLGSYTAEGESIPWS